MTKWDSEIHKFTIKHIKAKQLFVLVYKEVRIVEKQSKNKDSDKGGGEKKKELEEMGLWWGKAKEKDHWLGMIVVMRPSRDKEDKWVTE